MLHNLFIKKQKNKNTMKENTMQRNEIEMILNYLQPQFRTSEMLDKLCNEKMEVNQYERSQTASVEAIELVCYDYKLENEKVHVVCEEDYNQEDFINNYMLFKDAQNISFQEKCD